MPTPDYMKIDIEGAEFLALSGAKSTLVESHPIIFYATHGSIVHQKCCCLLQSIGYQLQPIDGMNLEQSSEIFATYKASQQIAQDGRGKKPPRRLAPRWPHKKRT